MNKIKLSSILHFLANLVFVLVVFLLCSVDLSIIAYLVVALSKWRTFAVRRTYWLPNLKKNGVDLAIGLSVVALISSKVLVADQIFIITMFIVYLAWLTIIKPLRGKFWVIFQAFFAQFTSLVALYIHLDISLNGVICLILTWLIGYSMVYHIFSSEHYKDIADADDISVVWSFLLACLGVVSWWWNVLYPLGSVFIIPQMAIVGTVLSYFLTDIVIHEGKGSDGLSRYWWQHASIVIVVAVIIIVLTNWDRVI